MGKVLKPTHWKRYKDVIRLLVKYGRGRLMQDQGLVELAGEEADEESSSKADDLARDLERLGPTFIKLGQLLSTRPELLPPPYLKALTRLQDDVNPFPFEDVETMVSEELGIPLSRAFLDFSREPLAAASLGQVHVAVLPDERVVAVKVQRPGIRKRIAEDMEALMEVADFLDKHTRVGKNYHFGSMLEDFRKSLVRELDYKEEAHNLEVIGGKMKRFPRIVIPGVVPEYSTARVLTMEYIRGTKITSMDPVRLADFDGEALADEVFRAYLEQILVDGIFHADPHPGNVFLTDEGRVALIDLGMVGRIPPKLQEHLLKLLLDIAEGRGVEAAEEAVKIGHPSTTFDEAAFHRRVSGMVKDTQDARMENLKLGQIVLEVTSTCAECGIRVPAELTMLGKTLLNLDQVGRTLAPDFDPNAAIRRHASEILNRQVWKSFSLSNFFNAALETKELVENLPRNLNRIMTDLSHRELKFKVETLDEEYLMQGFQKIANRITVGIILAAIIVGASMLARVDTDFELLGYPGLAIIFFITAAVGGVFLMINILFKDKQGSSHQKK